MEPAAQRPPVKRGSIKKEDRRLKKTDDAGHPRALRPGWNEHQERDAPSLGSVGLDVQGAGAGLLCLFAAIRLPCPGRVDLATLERIM